MSGVGWNGGPFELTYDGHGEFDDELRKPFLLFGAGTVIFKRGRGHESLICSLTTPCGEPTPLK
jgi:hypothetical protein